MARGTSKLEAKITADSSGFQAGINKANKSLESLEKTSASMTKQAKLLGVVIWTAVGVIAVKAATKVIKFGKELTELGQKSISLKRTFHSLAESMGADSTKLLADMKKNTRGMISEIDLITAANRMMLAGIDTSIFGEIVEIAKRTAGATGQSMEYMLSSLSDGLAKQSKMILDNLGIVFSVSDAYKWYAKEIGKVSSALTENEKRLAFQNYAMKIARENFEKIGAGSLSLRGMLTILGTTIEDLKARIGERLVEAINKIAERFGGWYNILDNFNKFINGTVIPAIENAAKWVDKFLNTFLKEDWRVIGLSIKTLAKSFGLVEGSIKDAESAATSFASLVSGAIITVTKVVLGLQYTFFGLATVITGIISWIYDIGLAIATARGQTEEYERTFGKFGEKVKEAFKKAEEGMDDAWNRLEEFTKKAKYLEENPPKIKMQDNFSDVLGRYQHMKSGLKDISRTITYTYQRRGGEPEFQFGGIIPKTQAILAHGGEMILTTAMQRNLLALLRQPRINYNYTVSGDVLLNGIQSEDMIREIARQVSRIQGEEVM